MTVKFTPEEWELLGRMYNCVAELKEQLEAKGFNIVCSLGLGIYKAALTFIVQRNGTEILSFCSFDIIAEESRVALDLFEKAEELINADLVAVEREYLLKRLAELNKPTNGKR